MLIALLLWMPSISSYMQYVYAAIWNIVWVLQPAAVQCCMSTYICTCSGHHSSNHDSNDLAKADKPKGFPGFLMIGLEKKRRTALEE
jgi:hypothetical protein